MKSMKSNKTSKNDRLTKKFYETFWDQLRTPLMGKNQASFLHQNHKFFTKASRNQAHWEKKTLINDE